MPDFVSAVVADFVLYYTFFWFQNVVNQAFSYWSAGYDSPSVTKIPLQQKLSIIFTMCYSNKKIVSQWKYFFETKLHWFRVKKIFLSWTIEDFNPLGLHL